GCGWCSRRRTDLRADAAAAARSGPPPPGSLRGAGAARRRELLARPLEEIVQRGEGQVEIHAHGDPFRGVIGGSAPTAIYRCASRRATRRPGSAPPRAGAGLTRRRAVSIQVVAILLGPGGRRVFGHGEAQLLVDHLP